MFLVLAAGRYQSSVFEFLTVAVSPFLGIQFDAEVHAADLGFINVRIDDLPEMEDGEYRKSHTPKVYGDLDNPYEIIPKIQRLPSSSTTLPTQQHQVAPLFHYFFLMDVIAFF
jgi:hypothetical protein